MSAPAEERVSAWQSAEYGIGDLTAALRLAENGDYGNAADSAREAAGHLDNAHASAKEATNE